MELLYNIVHSLSDVERQDYVLCRRCVRRNSPQSEDGGEIQGAAAAAEAAAAPPPPADVFARQVWGELEDMGERDLLDPRCLFLENADELVQAEIDAMEENLDNEKAEENINGPVTAILLIKV